MLWHQSLRWRLTLSFVGLLAVLLVVAGGIEYSLLSGATLSSRGQSLKATFDDGRAVLVAEERSRLRAGRPPLANSRLALNLVKVLAAAGLTAAVYSPALTEEASAGPGTASGVRTGVDVPSQSQSDLLAAAQYQTVIGPTLLGNGASSRLVMLLPLTGRLGKHLGAVEVVEPAGPIQSELASAAAVVAVGSGAVLLVALLIGLMLTARGLGPLSRLTAAAQALGRGDLSRRSGLRPRRDEVGELARVFDEMAENVEYTVKEREAAERRMRQFIGDASHELRTPVTAIKGYLDVLQRGAGASPEVVKAALPVMAQEAERMRALVMDLLTLARADAHRSVELRPVDLAAFLQRFLESRAQSTTVTLELQPGLVALADPDALATMAGNLQANAERHGQGREIVWSTVQERGLVGLRCADHGPGIDSADLPHVFERFFRASGSRSRQDGGSGLGLAIVQALAEAQGGQVVVESEPGQGARFTVLLLPTGAAGWVSAPPVP
ncbi:MAG TPA: HAMP domain-containing sensor histidine kinase [Candidatus Acidoferrales bacterium]|nr:HAMP domain-containing sensor histidine kinase [Candidatus Acidoferrales bacterium]